MKKRILIVIIPVLTILSLTSVAQTELKDCDSIVFTVTEVSPELQISFEKMEHLLNKKLDLENFETNNGDELIIQLLINCNGIDEKYTVLRGENRLLNNKIIEVLKEEGEWTPAYQLDEPVNYLFKWKFLIQNNHLHVLNSSMN